MRLHRLPPPFRSATTLLVWRHDQPQAKLRAPAAVLEESVRKKGRVKRAA